MTLSALRAKLSLGLASLHVRAHRDGNCENNLLAQLIQLNVLADELELDEECIHRRRFSSAVVQSPAGRGTKHKAKYTMPRTPPPVSATRMVSVCPRTTTKPVTTRGATIKVLWYAPSGVPGSTLQRYKWPRLLPRPAWSCLLWTTTTTKSPNGKRIGANDGPAAVFFCMDWRSPGPH
jgi:hypothetical protein